MPWREEKVDLPPPTVEEFRAAKGIVAGRANPELMEIPFWKYMVRTKLDPIFLPKEFHAFDASPVWCYDRMGMTSTVYEDRLFITIGGEHEDHYDPDFRIYNDVIIRDCNGRVWIYGYPLDVFPPTDFHTATVVPDDEAIYVIGGLGYKHDRQPGVTLVHVLTLDDMEIHRWDATGEAPGWIFKHEAVEIRPGIVQVRGGEIWTDDMESVANERVFELDLVKMAWTKLTLAAS